MVNVKWRRVFRRVVNKRISRIFGFKGKVSRKSKTPVKKSNLRNTLRHLPFTIYHSPFIIRHLPFTIYHSPFTIHHLPFTIYHSPFIIHHLSFTIWHLPFKIAIYFLDICGPYWAAYIHVSVNPPLICLWLEPRSECIAGAKQCF